MEGLFLQVLDRSITAGWLILAVVLVRFLLGKTPKWIRGILWGMVALRLVFPFSLESEFSLLPEKRAFESVIAEMAESSTIPMTHEAMMSEEHGTGTSVGVVDTHMVREEATMTRGVNTLSVVTILWLAGVGLLLVYCLLSFWKLRRRVADAVIYRKEKPAIYESEKVDSPFVLGLIKPCIYLPFRMSDEDRECVVAHEEAHISRGDHLIKPVGFLILAVYWFQPLVWLAYVLLCKDIEMACDEKVISRMSVADKKVYTKALLKCSKPQRMISACPLAFGEVGVRKRIINVLHYKKPAFWIVVVSISVCVIVAVCFLTEPKETVENTQVDSGKEMVDSHSQQEEFNFLFLEETKREEALANTKNDETISTKESGEKSAKVLTAPPAMYLQDVLSGYWNEFTVNSNTYGWSYRDEEGKVLCIDAAAKHGIGGEVKGKEWLQVHEYSRHDALYGARFKVYPDNMSIREYDLLDMGDMNPELLAEKTNERVDLLELKPRRMYEITVTWQEDKFEERGFSGTAVYVFATDNYAISGTELQGESLPVLIEAAIKETMVDTKDRICITSRTDGFPGAFIVIVPENVYDKTKLEGGQRITISMKDTGETESHMPIYEAIYLQPIVKVGEVKPVQGLNLPSVRERWTEEVNTFDGAELIFAKYTDTGGDLEIVNQSGKELQYGDWFDVQRKVEGEWYSLSYIIENVAFHAIAYNMPASETSIKPITWEWMYGKLPPGEYRIVTDVMDYRAPGDFDKYYLAEEFEIMQ